MLQINKNIKLIRELSGLKQEDFAKLIKVNLSNLKTYENSGVRPKAIVLAAIADVAGISTDDLENKALTHKDVNLRVDKFDINNPLADTSKPLSGATPTLQDYIDDLKRSRDMFYSLLSSSLGNLEKGQKTLIAYQKAWVQYEADRASGGDPDKKAEIMYKMNTLADEYREGEVSIDIHAETGKHRKG